MRMNLCLQCFEIGRDNSCDPIVGERRRWDTTLIDSGYKQFCVTAFFYRYHSLKKTCLDAPLSIWLGEKRLQPYIRTLFKLLLLFLVGSTNRGLIIRSGIKAPKFLHTDPVSVLPVLLSFQRCVNTFPETSTGARGDSKWPFMVVMPLNRPSGA